MKILFLILMLSIGAFCQNVDKITSRCPSPNRSIYGNVLIQTTGDVVATPCPNRSSIFNGNNTWNATVPPYGLFWQPAKPQLAVFDIITPTFSGTGIPYFTVGSNATISVNQQALSYIEGHFSGGSSPSSNYSGLEININGRNTAGGGNSVNAIFVSASNTGDTSGASTLTGIQGVVDITTPTTLDASGGIFQSFKGGSGATTVNQYGSKNQAFCGHNSSTVLCVGSYGDVESLGGGVQTVTTMIPFQSTVILRGNTAVTEIRGISFHNWAKNGGDTITRSSAIYADTSIDIGATSRTYFINSLSTSPSVMAGDLAFTDPTKGIILISPNATCYRLKVDNAGALSTSSVTCPFTPID